MAMLSTVSVSLTSGRLNVPPLPISTGFTTLTAQIDRSQMAAFTGTVSWQCDLSLDGGVTWRPWGAAGTVGGALTNPKTGLPITVSSYRVTLPDPTNPHRRLRGSLTTNAPLVTTLTVSAT